MCVASVSVMNGSVLARIWHQTPPWSFFQSFPWCVVMNLEEGYCIVPQVLLLCFVCVCVHYPINSLDKNTPSVLSQFCFAVAADRGFI